LGRIGARGTPPAEEGTASGTTLWEIEDVGFLFEFRKVSYLYIGWNASDLIKGENVIPSLA